MHHTYFHKEFSFLSPILLLVTLSLLIMILFNDFQEYCIHLHSHIAWNIACTLRVYGLGTYAPENAWCIFPYIHISVTNSHSPTSNTFPVNNDMIKWFPVRLHTYTLTYSFSHSMHSEGLWPQSICPQNAWYRFPDQYQFSVSNFPTSDTFLIDNDIIK